MTRTIYQERIPSSDPRCRRHILHDSESRRYVFDTSGLSVGSVEHHRTLPILDQGQVGSCTAEAGFGVLGTEPYSGSQAVGAAITKAFGGWSQDACYRLYSAEEALDGDGPYPPNDNGSTGLTLAKALRNAGAISGWTQTFTLDDALKALQLYPLAVGTYWYNSMFDPDGEGVVTVDTSSGIAGGHEYEVVGYDSARDLVKAANSWGDGWGAGGYFYLDSLDFGRLLAKRGDVTVFTPASQPAPAPTPTDAYSVWSAVAGPWAAEHHVGANAAMARATRAYLAAVGGQH